MSERRYANVMRQERGARECVSRTNGKTTRTGRKKRQQYAQINTFLEQTSTNRQTTNAEDTKVTNHIASVRETDRTVKTKATIRHALFQPGTSYSTVFPNDNPIMQPRR